MFVKNTNIRASPCLLGSFPIRKHSKSEGHNFRKRPGFTAQPDNHMTSHKYSAPDPFESSTCVVYAVELDPSVVKEPEFLKKNPRWNPDKPAFYVGMTSLSPQERFEQHHSGSKNPSRIAHEYGLSLRMDVVTDKRVTRRKWAMEGERRLVRNLRAQGFGAWMG